ncbi:30S ribosomal protein S4 [Conexibacter sp. SYSU D00693]|uniref:30S ribosomal protein S4 n=1 Tax=Conexibacter sp. SYSU D00693 TaxID=2812560 RepID=UPI00196B3483|nr:30S ribosomal protein S4 [Conexibacter sp. SYSU D00693]
MGRYTGPVEKLERREGVALDLKGERHLRRKTALERRGAQPPGEHGMRRRRAPSVYAQQLRETQKLKIAYGVRERQFRRYVLLARKRRDITAGEALLELLERRLDNVVFCLGLATTRRQARQFVAHGHVHVDGRRVDICSALLDEGARVTLRAGSPVEPLARDATETVGRVPGWLEADHDGLSGRVLRRPRRDEISIPVTEQLVIERYSRR